MRESIWSRLKRAFGLTRSTSVPDSGGHGLEGTQTDSLPDSCESQECSDGDAEQPIEPFVSPSGTDGTNTHGTQRMTLDWDRWPNFSESEMACKHTGKTGMKAQTMDRLQAVRTAYGKPMTVTSGYRHPTHPIEARKASPGAHASGQAVDIAVGPGQDVYELVQLAMAHGFRGIGISQRGGQPRFVHLDDLPRFAIWSY